MPRVLITDGRTRATLAAVRSLGRSGHDVYVAAERLPALACVSRFARGCVPAPSPAAAPDAFVERLAEAVESLGIEVVIPATDASMGAILRAAGNRLGGAAVAAPAAAAYEAVTDKSALVRRAEQLGAPVPHTILADAPSQVEAAAAAVGYPCILKPHRSVIELEQGFGNVGVSYLSGPADLSLAATYPPGAFPLLVQQRIVGPAEGVFLLMDGGRRIAAFAHRRIRENPPSGGASTYRASIPLPQDLTAWSEVILADVGWTGVAMVEYKRSADTGHGYLMEVNGRLWGSLQLAIDAGVDFPAMLVQIALGQPVQRVDSYRLSVRSRWFWGDVDHLLARLRHSPAALDLSPEAESRARLVWEFMKVWRRGDRFEVWDSGDPQPFLHESRAWLSERGKTLLKRRRGFRDRASARVQPVAQD